MSNKALSTQSYNNVKSAEYTKDPTMAKVYNGKKHDSTTFMA